MISFITTALASTAINSETLPYLDNPNQIIGVMTCDAYWQDIMFSGAYDIYGCADGRAYLSINNFFERYRRSEDFQISRVVYQDQRFYIYYGK